MAKRTRQPSGARLIEKQSEQITSLANQCDVLQAKLTAPSAQMTLMSDSFDSDQALIKAQRAEIESLRGLLARSYRWYVFLDGAEWAVTLRDGDGVIGGLWRTFDSRGEVVSFALRHSGEVDSHD